MTSRRRATVVVSCLAILLVTCVGTVSAQETEGDGRNGAAWLTGGLGKGTEGIAAVAGADISSNQHVISFRTATTGPLFDGGDTYWDAGLLYGRAFRWPEGLVAASAGIGVMGGFRTEDHLSVPLALRMSWHQTTWLGFGAYAFLNLNPEQSFGGVTLTLELGMLQ